MFTFKTPLPLAIALILRLCAVHVDAQPAPSTPEAPTPTTAFRFEPADFKFINHDAEFRDSADRLWPNFYIGRPEAGGTLDLGAAPSIALAVVYNEMVQKNGHQSRKVLGELSSPGKFPVVTLRLNRISEFQPEAVKGKPGKPGKTRRYTARLGGVLQVGERRVEVAPDGLIVVHTAAKGATERITIDANVTVKASELGLAKVPADTVVKVRLTTNGKPATAPVTVKK
jgi:hypothetical protein